MWAAFQAKPDLTPYQALPARVPIDEKNLASAYGAERSSAWDLRDVDSVKDAEFNEILWRACKGPEAAMPPRRVAAFVREADSIMRRTPESSPIESRGASGGKPR